MKKEFYILLFLTVALLFNQLLLSAENINSIKVGVYNNYPKVYINEHGQASGIFPEIMAVIAEKQGWEIIFVEGTWNEGLKRLEDEEIDVMVDVALSDERKLKYDFNLESVLVSWGCIYSRTGKDINTILDLEGKKIAVMKNSILTNGQEGIVNLVELYGVNCIFVEVADYYDVFSLIQQGEVDAGVTNRHFGAAFEDQYNVRMTNLIFYPTQLRLAFPKDSDRSAYFIPRIDEVLREMQKDTDSEYYTILAKYNLYPKKGIPEWIIPLLAGLLGIAIFFTIVYMMAKWRIKQQTRALQSTNEVLKQEIAEHQRTLRELALSRENYRNFVENIPGLVYMYDQDEDGTRTPVITTNRNEEFLGKEVAGMIKENYSSFFDQILPEDKERIQELSKEVEDTDQAFNYEYRVQISDDEVKWFRSIGRVKNLTNGKKRWQGVILDINQRKQAEEDLEIAAKRWQTTFDSSNDAIWILDTDQRILQVNESALRIFETTKDKLVNTFCCQAIHNSKNPIPDCPFVRMTKSKKREVKELKLPKERWVLVTVDPIFDNQHNIVGAVHNVRDISERKKIEHELELYREQLEEIVKTRTEDLERKTKELEKANIDLQEADRLKSIFLASMSHELRTPLNSIIGFTGILLMGMVGELSDEQKTQLKIVKSSANHLLELINDILDISKIEAGKVELHKEAFMMNDIITEVLDTFKHSADDKGLELKRHLGENIEVYTDMRRFKQVIFNLVGNAVKFTDKGTVSVTTELKDNREVDIIVKDTGIGIKNEDMGKLFEPFQQIDSELTKKREGTGLGLHLTKKIMNLLNGKIHVESTPDEGTTFIITFPHIIKENNNEDSISN
ncbi:MAG: transporter substrate-binding domain-containing protein [Candidatus Cloacimonetes bacterium]|nr:transporter substrate-binding domain-containing protein [Candidatus Cloacimonadota bacterium]